MSWRSRGSGTSAWRQCLTPLRQEAASKGLIARQSLQGALETLKVAAAEIQDNELAEDLSFLVQQLLGPPPTHGAPSAAISSRDTTPHVALCRLLTSLVTARSLNLHSRAANLILSALRQWSDGAQDGAATPSPSGPSSFTPTSTTATGCNGSSSTMSSASTAAAAEDGAAAASAATPTPSVASLQLEAMTALAALLPDHLGLLSEHERAAQLAALTSLLVPPQPHRQQAKGAEGARVRAADSLELQVLALTALTACCGRANATAASGNGLTADEASAVLSAAVSLLQAVACRSRPVEDTAHSRLYAALVRALQAAIVEAKQAWVARAAMLVEGLQRFLTYGVQASLTVAAAVQPPSSPAPPVDSAAASGGGGRYRPPHLRRRESQTDGASSAWSDSDMSDSEHAGGGGGGSGAGAGGAAATVVDRFRSSRVRLGTLSCVQAMAKSDPRAMHVHWSALLPLQAPLQPRPLTPHLITVLLYDPLIKVRLLAAATVSSLLDGPAQRSILAVAEAKTPLSARAPLRGFLTLSLSLGQLLLAAHAGLLAAVGGEPSALALPGMLRALVVLMAASPYERLPPELLPETLRVLRTRWAALTAAAAPAPHTGVGVGAAGAAAAAGELAPIQAAYMACLAECFSTKQPIPGLAAYLLQPQPHQRTHQQHQQPLQSPSGAAAVGGSGAAAAASAAAAAGGGGGSGGSTEELVRELLGVGRDAGAAAVLRIEALAALKGLAAHYTAALPPDVWEDLRATAAVGLSCIPTPRGSPGPSRSRDGPPSRSSSSSSLGGGGGGCGAGAAHGSRGRAAPWASPSRTGGGGAPAALSATAGSASSSANSSPEDKAAQLSVKLLSDYLSAAARQYGISRTDAAAGAGAGDGGDGGLPGPPPSPSFVPLGAAVPRGQLLQQHAGLLSPVSVTSEEEREAGVQRLAAMWQDAVGVLVPAATSHASYMVRSAGLACLGEIPEPVFSSLPPRLQHQLLLLLSDAAASDAVPAVRAAACKALGAAAAFPAVLAAPQLSDQVTRALLPCLRDSVLSARIAAGWAVANLCDAYRRRLLEAAPGSERAESHARATTSARSPTARAAAGAGAASPPPLEPHHYRQLAALCGAAITATQDADKVRANGIRAVGYLLATLTPELAPGLATASAAGAAPAAAEPSGGGGASGSWRAARRDTPAPGAATYGNTSIAGNSSAGGGGAEGTIQLDVWLDSALTCLQSTLTTGGMKVQWNACCAAHGLLRNQRLLAHPRVGGRVAPLLLLLVMLVRESANFKIRTHAAAALAALPSRTAYGDLLPDALLVTAGALESVSSGGGGGGGGAAKPAGAGGGGGGAEQGDGDGDADEGRFPNYRYTLGLSVQLRSSLLHLLALAQPSDARRLREALARRAEFLHACLREQLAETAQPLRAAAAAAARSGGAACGASGPAVVDLPSDPFGLSAGRGGSSPGGPAASAGLAGLLAGLSLAAAAEGHRPSSPWRPDVGTGPGVRGTRDEPAGAGGGGTAWDEARGTERPHLTVRVSGGGVEEEDELQRARGRVAALWAPLRGFADLLAQLGPSVDAVLQDVRQALAQLQPPSGGSISGP